MTYAPSDGDDEGRLELGQELLARCRPLEEGSPAWRYLTEARGLPAHAINFCKADLRQIEPMIPGFDRLAYGVVSLLRDSTGDITGLAVETCGPAGERMLGKDGRTARRSFRLRERGCAEALFRVEAPGLGAMVAYLTEGRLAKVLAVAAVLDDPAIYGWGGRPSLGIALPAGPTAVVVADQRPANAGEAEQHDRDYERGCDRLLLAGRMVRLAELGCACCKDVDEAIQRHLSEEVRECVNGGDKMRRCDGAKMHQVA